MKGKKKGNDYNIVFPTEVPKKQHDYINVEALRPREDPIWKEVKILLLEIDDGDAVLLNMHLIIF